MKKKKSHKKVKDNSNTILLIVENSEADFFNQYFKGYLEQNYQILIDCEPSAIGNKCEITNGNRMGRRVNEAIGKENYKAVVLMMDLKTKCIQSERTHTCLKELKKEYLPKYQIEKSFKKQFYLFVVCNEIESWFLTINKNTNNPHDNHKKEIMKLFKVNDERQIVAKVIQDLRGENMTLDFSKNSSLQFFIDKLKEL
ncbi:MAG: hypothetical protein U9N49_07905 [Campylobacterota bacterium]|nr:hypothetical protein [Campylobacterota bacterium]